MHADLVEVFLHMVSFGITTRAIPIHDSLSCPLYRPDLMHASSFPRAASASPSHEEFPSSLSRMSPSPLNHCGMSTVLASPCPPNPLVFKWNRCCAHAHQSSARQPNTLKDNLTTTDHLTKATVGGVGTPIVFRHRVWAPRPRDSARHGRTNLIFWLCL